MKSLKIIFLIAAMGVSTYAMAQQKVVVPQSIVTDFSNKYPQARVKNWQAEKNQYIVSFVLNKQEVEARYNKDGNWISTATTLWHISDIPHKIIDSLRQSKFASYHINEAKNIETPSNTMYRLEVDNNSGNKQMYDNLGSYDNQWLYFSPDGQLIKYEANPNE